jgi:anaerobic magnesium-protoporphyrin IX monomethyl ester cyclase
MVRTHELGRAWRSRWLARPQPRVIEETSRALDERRPDVLLMSAYVDHYPSVRVLAALAAKRNVPVLLGGPVFNIPEIAREWLDIPGLTALVGGEMDLTLPALVADVVEGNDLTQHHGVVLPDGRRSAPAPPLQALDALPVPDFSDFPWDKYPTRVIPVMTGRGCSWGNCLFCGDVKTANGRTFRSRPVEAVLDELEEQSARYGTKDVIFLDIKLNSNLEMWRGIIDGFQKRLPGGRWIGTVHVQATGENGLSADELYAARRAGMLRTNFGLETGSQRLNNAMAKGTSLDATSQFIRDAYAAGISVRTTAMLGYPGETSSDIDASIRFLEEHEGRLDRVRLSRFKAIPGTRFHELYERRPSRFPGVTHFQWNFRYARARYRYAPATDRGYRRSKARLLGVIHRINRTPLRPGAEVFDGLM